MAEIKVMQKLSAVPELNHCGKNVLCLLPTAAFHVFVCGLAI